MAIKLPLTNDYVFKRIFGQEDNKSALKDFLECILDVKIENIKINNPEIPKNYYDSKFGILDLKVTLNDGILVDVEMQMQNQNNVEQRMPYYMASNYSNTIKEGDPYLACKKSIVISILNFNYYKRNEYHSIARMIFEEPKPEEVVDMGYQKEDKYATKYLEMHIIDLSKFKKKNPQMHTKIAQWLWLFIGSDEQMEKAGKLNKEIRKINKKLASMSLSDEERNNYEFRLKAIRDEADAMERATKEGFSQGVKQGIEQGIEQGIKQGIEQGVEQGIEQGLEKGKKQEKKEIAKRMLKRNTDIKEIIEILGLTKEEIEKIKKEI